MSTLVQRGDEFSVGNGGRFEPYFGFEEWVGSAGTLDRSGRRVSKPGCQGRGSSREGTEKSTTKEESESTVKVVTEEV